ncbi:MAG: hypothetical protein SGPRY_005430 [Prymnesium sp.]
MASSASSTPPSLAPPWHRCLHPQLPALDRLQRGKFRELSRIAAIRALGRWLLISLLEEREPMQQSTAVGALLGVCDPRESESLRKEAVSAI